MTGRWIRILLVLALLAASIPVLVAAATTESIISVGSEDSDQWYPVISGDRITWLDTRGGTGEIYLYDILTGVEQRVSAAGAMCETPDISGDHMVWRVWNESYGGYDLDIHDLSTGEHTIIASGGVDHGNPAIEGSLVVWDDMRAGNPDIYLYDLSTGQEIQITNNTADQSNPDISGDQIVFQDFRRTNWDIFLHNLTTKKAARIASDNTSAQYNPAISGDIIVFQDEGNVTSEIHFYNTTSKKESRVTKDPSPALSPSVSGNQMVWENTSTGDTEIWLYNLTVNNNNKQTRITRNTAEQVSPSIDGDRIVWSDYRDGMADIYLATLRTSLTVPGAAFSADPTIGGSPLTVQFTDESTGDPTTWRWDFGDGETSTEQSPSHTYAAEDTYSVTLTVSNPVGRSRAAMADYIHSGSGPSPSFTANSTAGITPLTVQFTDTSTGDPTTWAWDFGDGGTSAEQHPAHTYAAGGVYTVSLTAGNLFGENSATLATPIEVLNGTRAAATTEIEGLRVEECGGTQCAYVESGRFSSFQFDPTGDTTVLSVVPPPASGWSEITLQSRGAGFSDMGNGTLTGTVTDVMLESSAITPDTFSPQTGNNLVIAYALNLSRYPVLGTVDTVIWENVTGADHPRFLQAAADANYAGINAVAYTLDFTTVNINSLRGVTFNLSARTTWVARNGIPENMTLLRLGNDGSRQGMKYRVLVSDPAQGLDYYLFDSPRGLSKFALASLSGSGNPFQLLVLSASTRASTPSGPTGSSSNDFPPGAPPSVPQPVQPAEPLFFRETGRPDLTGSGITTRPFSIQSADQGVSLTIAADTLLQNTLGVPLRDLSVLSAAPSGISPPAESAFTYSGVAYDLQPDGMVFDPPAEVQFRVDPGRWQDAARYQVLSRRNPDDPWEAVPTRQDDATRTVTGQVSHFSLHALFYEPVPVTTPPQGLPTIQIARQPAEPRPVPRTPLATITGVIFWAANTTQGRIPEVMVALLLVGGIAFTFRRGVPVQAFRPWVFLYLISLSAYTWATFQALTGGPLWLSSWIFMATAGLNMIVHFLRFDRIPLIPSPVRRWSVERL
jgi:beta propeller repeat protein